MAFHQVQVPQNRTMAATSSSTANNTAYNASNGGANNAPSVRGPGYVVFERLPQQAFSRTSLEKATAAKLKLEHYYKKAVDDVVERNAR